MRRFRRSVYSRMLVPGGAEDFGKAAEGDGGAGGRRDGEAAGSSWFFVIGISWPRLTPTAGVASLGSSLSGGEAFSGEWEFWEGWGFCESAWWEEWGRWESG